MKAEIRLDHSLLALETDNKVHAMLELTAPAAPQMEERPPLNIALVIDRSGSMAGEKLEVTKRCAAFLVERLGPKDHLCLIDFDDQVRLLCPLIPVNKPSLLAAIARIHSGGSTNLSGGWLKGMEELKRATSGPRKLILLTDGQANAGIVDPSALAGMARASLAEGRATTTIGLGFGFDEDLLTAMADSGGGNSYFAQTPDQAPAIFAEEFDGLSSIVAQNVSVEIRPGTDVQLLSILNEYPVVSVPGGVQIQLGDAYGEDRRRVVFELEIPRLARLGLAKVADAIVRYVSVGDSIEDHTVTLPMHVNAVNADEAAAADPNNDVIEEVLVLKAAKAQEDARRRFAEGDTEGAQKLLKDAADDLRRLAPDSEQSAQLLEQAEVIDGSLMAMHDSSFGEAEMKNLKYNARMQSRRRR
ncbi:MAG: VWA domain-containing protein [Actinomycetota bacterium]